MPSAADDIASAMTSRWADTFSKFDPEAQASLYSKHALFFGSNPTLYQGRDGVAAYFKGLPKWNSRAVRFTDVSTAKVVFSWTPQHSERTGSGRRVQFKKVDETGHRYHGYSVQVLHNGEVIGEAYSHAALKNQQ